MIRNRIGTLTSAVALAVASGLVLADADIAVQPAGTAMAATANVDLSVVVPQILVFGVGAAGDDIASLQWTVDNAGGAAPGNNQSYAGPVPFTAPPPAGSSATAAVLANGGIGSGASGNEATLPVFLFSNSDSDVSISTTVSGGSTGGGSVNALDNDTVTGATIPISDFLAGDGGQITQPPLDGTGAATTSPVGGVVNLTDTWTYTFSPTTSPAAGTYRARVTYAVSTP